jgi:hypothetical protein
MDNDSLISNVKKKNISYTKYKSSPYTDKFYCDDVNKICILYTLRAGCSISFQQFLDLVGLLNDGLGYFNINHQIIHAYRFDIMDKHIKYVDMNELIKNNYTFIKFIMNPYIRAVSIFRIINSHNLSFREHLKDIINNRNKTNKYIIYDTQHETVHSQLQYIDGEEKIITKYIKIDKYETYEVKLADNSLYTIDVNKYTSIHHGKKTDYCEFCGDLPLNEVNQKLPKSYKYFYDDEIRKLVETYYKNDIEKYSFSFDNF